MNRDLKSPLVKIFLPLRKSGHSFCYIVERCNENLARIFTKSTSLLRCNVAVLYREGAGDPEFIKRQDQKRSDLDEQLREYITEWRKQRAKEEEDLKKLKEKQAKRKVARADEERKMAERKKAEEERRVREIEEKKQRDIEEKRQRLEEAEKKRQAMMQALKDQNKNKGPNFTITKKDAAVRPNNNKKTIYTYKSVRERMGLENGETSQGSSSSTAD